MPKVSSVQVRYARKAQPRPYESADAEVSVTLLYDDAEESRPLDEEIEDLMGRAVLHVNRTLGLSEGRKVKAVLTTTDRPAEAGEKPLDGPDRKGVDKAPAKSKPKPAAAEEDPFEAPAKKPAKKAEDGPRAYTRGDAMKAITQALERLTAAGDPTGPQQVSKIVRGYLPDDKPPHSYTRIPEDSLADFISDIDKLGR